MSEFRPESAIVLTGGIEQKPSGNFRPTDFNDSDQYGMLGGDIRVTAAVSMYLTGCTQRFMFLGGKSVKAGDLENYDSPTPAEVYTSRFFEQLGELATRAEIVMPIKDPLVVPNGLPSNTTASLELLPEIMKQDEFANPAIVTSRYHIPRTKMLFDRLMRGNKRAQNVEFISAEDVVLENHPGLFDHEINEAYYSDIGQTRMANEEQGIKDMQQGDYQFGENLRYLRPA